MRIIEIVATRCQIWRLKCTKFGFVQHLEHSPRPLAAFKGPTSRGREGGQEGQSGGERKGWEVPPALLILPGCGVLEYLCKNLNDMYKWPLICANKIQSNEIKALYSIWPGNRSGLLYNSPAPYSVLVRRHVTRLGLGIFRKFNISGNFPEILA